MTETLSNQPHLLCLAVRHSDSVCNHSSLKTLLPYSNAFSLIECNKQIFLICVGCHPMKTLKIAYVAAALLKQNLFA